MRSVSVWRKSRGYFLNECMENEMITKDKQALQYINKIIHDKTGIYLPEEKNYLLIHKMSRLLKNNDQETLNDFCNMIKNGNNDEINKLINNFTTNHTFFFREKSHLTILANDIKIKRKNNPLIWCAASSTGEEVYSIIISLLENNISNFTIVASDINSKVLIHMKKGIYNETRLGEIDKKIARKYFIKVTDRKDSRYRVKEHLRKYFVTKRINLIENIKFEKKFDYIFCRNVLMYFNKNTQESVINMLLKNLNDSGFLFVGHSESLLHLNNNLESVFNSVYTKRLC